MKRVCAWCEAALDDSAGAADEPVTHGICPECSDYFFGGGGSLPELLERFEAPVLVVGAGAAIEHANRRAREVLGKRPAQIEGRLGGEVIECIYARLPGGCGQTVHCQACTIRLSVTETLRTGRGLEKVPCYQDVITPRGAERVRLLVSTEKRGEVVLLRIDGLPEADGSRPG